MNEVKFEQMLSFNPKLTGRLITEVCLRDMIYQYYSKVVSEEAKADAMTHDYIAKLWERVGTRTF